MGITPLPVGYLGDGYDWMEALKGRWSIMPSWGKDGWDLGSWPYVVIAVYVDRANDEYAMATYCEGTIRQEEVSSLEVLYELLDKAAEFYWRAGTATGPADLPATGLLDHHKGPYRRDRHE